MMKTTTQKTKRVQSKARKLLFGTFLGLLFTSYPSEVTYASGSSDAVTGRYTVPLSSLIPAKVQRAIAARKEGTLTEQESLPTGLPDSVDLRSRDTSVKRQPGPYCSTFGLLSAMENLLGGKTDLSWRHGWSKYRKYSSEAALSAFSQSGVVETVYWPDDRKKGVRGYKDQEWYQLTQFTYLEDSIPKTLQALDQGHPVYLALSTPAELYECNETVSPTTALLPNSGHAIAIVGYRLDATEGAAGGHFLIKNSWGEQCGDRGYQWIPFNFCKRSDAYCMMWDIAGVAVQ